MEQRPQKSEHQNDKRCPLALRPNRVVYETLTPINHEILVILNEMDKRDWVSHPAPRKNEAPMGSDHDQYF